MKKVILTVSIALASVFSVKAQSEYNYKAKFEGVTDATKATPVINSLKTVFKTPASFNESTQLIEFNSKMSISQTVFNNMMMGEGYQVESFSKQEVKTEVAAAPVEVKKASIDSSALKTSVATAKKEAPKAGTPPKGTAKSK